MQKDLSISRELINWYGLNKRELPWRNTNDPYIIWISEIILQQTRVAQGESYFRRFIERFPDVKSLADAEEIEVLKLWQGLGYYSRARNLHNAAKAISTVHNMVFPTQLSEILKLKGIGEYTAAAIASFAYNQPHAVVDGNVFRVLSRLYAVEEPIDTGKGKKLFAELAREILDEKNPGIHNQAIMEFGALQCLPVNPKCNVCPLTDKCLAYAAGEVDVFPVKQGKIKTTDRFLNYLDVRLKNNVYLNKRENKDIWMNLYEFPLIETTEKIRAEDLIKHPLFVELFGAAEIDLQKTWEAKHVLSHQIIYATFYKVEMSDENRINHNYLEVPKEKLEEYPVSRLIQRYIDKLV